MSHDPSPPIIQGNKVWCPVCKEYVQLLKVPKAAQTIDVTPRTIYRYIQEGKIHTIDNASARRRVCSNSLLKPHP